MVDKIASNRILVQQDAGASERTHQKGVRCYKTFGVLAKVFGVGMTVQGEGGKTVVVNKKSYEAFLGRNPTFVGTGTATKIVSHAADMTASVKDVRQLFTDLSKEGIKIDSKVQKEIIASQNDKGIITLNGAQLNVLKTEISKILKTHPKTSEELQGIVKNDVKEAPGAVPVMPAKLKEIQDFKFDSTKKEKMVLQLAEKSDRTMDGPGMIAVVAGAMESPENARALLGKILPNLKDVKTAHKDKGTIKEQSLGFLGNIDVKTAEGEEAKKIFMALLDKVNEK